MKVNRRKFLAADALVAAADMVGKSAKASGEVPTAEDLQKFLKPGGNAK